MQQRVIYKKYILMVWKTIDFVVKHLP